jgi:hypothetical protein
MCFIFCTYKCVYFYLETCVLTVFPYFQTRQVDAGYDRGSVSHAEKDVSQRFVLPALSIQTRVRQW